MHDVALFVLMRRTVSYHIGDEFFVGIDMREAILKLIAEAYGAARLIKAASSFETRGIDLIRQRAHERSFFLGNAEKFDLGLKFKCFQSLFKHISDIFFVAFIKDLFARTDEKINFKAALGGKRDIFPQFGARSICAAGALFPFDLCHILFAYDLAAAETFDKGGVARQNVDRLQSLFEGRNFNGKRLVYPR